MLSIDQRIEFLRSAELFQDVSPLLLQQVAGRMGERDLPAGEILFLENDPGDAIYFVVEGEIEIVHEQEDRSLILAALQSPSIFGEMAVLTEGVRSASARARGNARLLFLKKKAVRLLLQSVPALAYLLFRVLARRLREANDRLLALTTASGPPAHLHLESGSETRRIFPVVGDRVELGRRTGSTLTDISRVALTDPNRTMEPLHAEITRKGDDYFVQHLAERGETRVNGEVITAPVCLQDGDCVEIGETRLRFRRAAGEPAGG